MIFYGTRFYVNLVCLSKVTNNTHTHTYLQHTTTLKSDIEKEIDRERNNIVTITKNITRSCTTRKSDLTEREREKIRNY